MAKVSSFVLFLLFTLFEVRPVLVGADVNEVLAALFVLLPLWFAILIEVMMPTAPFAKRIGFNGLIKEIYQIDRRSLVLVFGFYGIVMIALLRGVLNKHMGTLLAAMQITILGGLSLYLFLLLRRLPMLKIVMSLIVSIGFFLILNMLLYFIGFATTSIETFVAPGQAVLLGILGIEFDRVALPLGSGVNNTGIESGLGVVLGAVAAIRSKGSHRILFLAIMFAGIAAVILTDSRGAILHSLLVIMVILIPSLRARVATAAKWFIFLIPLFPIFLLGGSIFLSEFEFMSMISRDSGSFMSTRDIIWASVFYVLSEIEPIHAYGYGLYGQVTSGAYDLYGAIFEANINYGGAGVVYSASAHNTMLQLVLDIGYFGAFLFLLLLRRQLMIFGSTSTASITLMSENTKTANLLIMAGLMYFALVGLTEVTVYYNTPLLFGWFLAACVFLLFSKIEVSGIKYICPE